MNADEITYITSTDNPAVLDIIRGYPGNEHPYNDRAVLALTAKGSLKRLFYCHICEMWTDENHNAVSVVHWWELP